MECWTDRRTFLGTAITGGTAGLAGCVDGEDPTDETPTTVAVEPTPSPEPPAENPLPESIGLEPLADGLDQAIDIVFPTAERSYVATQPGTVLVFDDWERRGEPLLDLTDRIVSGGERGLLGIALHPAFADNRRLFVRYSSAARPGTPDEYSHTEVLAEFAVYEDGTTADPDSERTIMEIPHPQGNHNAGDIRFGPDGLIYVASGDGGAGGDAGIGHPDDWYDANEGGNGQDTEEFLLGGILRIDVDATPTEHHRTDADAPDEPATDAAVAVEGRAPGYAIPDENPLTDVEGHHDEYYAWGLRNPWRTSFDGGRYYVGDVGQSAWEMVYVLQPRGNYGWNVREGSHCFRAEECPEGAPPHVRGSFERFLDPIIEYPNENPTAGSMNGVAVVGGVVYRGDAVPQLYGRYVFGDLRASSRLFVGTPPGEGEDEWGADVVPLTDNAASQLEGLRSFGRDVDGDVYVLDGDRVFRLAPA